MAKASGVREALVRTPEESKNPGPVSGTGPSNLRGLFHPNGNTVAKFRCAMVAATLNVG